MIVWSPSAREAATTTLHWNCPGATKPANCTLAATPPILTEGSGERPPCTIDVEPKPFANRSTVSPGGAVPQVAQMRHRDLRETRVLRLAVCLALSLQDSQRGWPAQPVVRTVQLRRSARSRLAYLIGNRRRSTGWSGHLSARSLCLPRLESLHAPSRLARHILRYQTCCTQP